MQGKKSFLLYADLIHTVDHLTDEQAGKLFRHVLAYVNDQNPETDDPFIKLAFEPIKQSLKRDLEKWNNIVERNRENGKKGGRPKKPKKPNGLIGNPKEPKKADNDIDSDTDSDIGNDINNRKAEFKNSLLSYQEKYTVEMLKNFFDYWSEHNEKGKKMRFEMSKNQPFNVSRRLATWQKKEKEFSSNKKKGFSDALDQADRLKNIYKPNQ